MRREHACWKAAALACLAALAAWCGPAGGALSVRAVSHRAGLVFADSEKVEVYAAVAGAGASADVAYAAADCAGPWRQRGEVRLPALRGGAGRARLPLTLPGRGLYKLALTARSAGRTATAETHVAVVFTPVRPDPNSPWGIFYTPPTWFGRLDPNAPRDAARSHRLLGAAWTRLNFWAHSYDKVHVTAGDDPKVTLEVTTWKRFARALRAEGISILGEIAQCPRELSSRPAETATVGDAGAVWGRVKPRDYGLWEQAMAAVARSFREEIGVWEIWNEPNLRNRYWTGTVEDFAELVARTARGLRLGNAKARIAAGGFVGDVAFADRLFQLGMGRHVDILSVHYTDERPDQIAAWRRLLARHGLRLAIWNTEERSEVPLRNLASPIERSFKFIHVRFTDRYDHYRPLVRRDWTPLPAGIAFSVGAHCIGAGTFAGREQGVEGYDVFYFRRGAETVAAFDPGQKTGAVKLFGPRAEAVTLAVEPLAGRRATVTDIWGRRAPLTPRDGRVELALDGRMLFVNGCAKIGQVRPVRRVGVEAGVFEAEAGRWSKGWSASAKAGFSGGRVLEIWQKPDPPAGGYWAELKIAAAEAGRYELLFSGNGLGRLKDPPSLSPFSWRIDAGRYHAAHGQLPVRQGVTGAPEGLTTLGTVDLGAGEHTFRLELTGRRAQPDNHYALWFDAIALRKVRQGGRP